MCATQQRGGLRRAFYDVDELIDAGIFTEKHIGVVNAVPFKNKLAKKLNGHNKSAT